MLIPLPRRPGSRGKRGAHVPFRPHAAPLLPSPPPSGPLLLVGGYPLLDPLRCLARNLTLVTAGYHGSGGGRGVQPPGLVYRVAVEIRVHRVRVGSGT